MKVIRWFSLLTVFIVACHHGNNKITNVTLTAPKQLSKTDTAFADTTITAADTAHILMKQTSAHAFSDPAKKDTFKLYLTGSSLIGGKVVFMVIAYNGKAIYTEKFKAYDLLGDLDDVSPTPNQREDTIMARFSSFFNSSAFVRPALDTKEPLDDVYIDTAIQQDIRTDIAAIGFVYAYGYEGVQEIAWSKKHKKVVICMASD